MTYKDRNTEPFDPFSKHVLGKTIYKLRNYESLKKETEHLFADGYTFFTESKLRELAKSCDVKLVARGRMTIDLDRHERPVYSSKIVIEAQNFTGPSTEFINDHGFLWILILAALFLFLVILLLLSLDEDALAGNAAGKYFVVHSKWIRKKWRRCKRKTKKNYKKVKNGKGKKRNAELRF